MHIYITNATTTTNNNNDDNNNENMKNGGMNCFCVCRKRACLLVA